MTQPYGDHIAAEPSHGDLLARAVITLNSMGALGQSPAQALALVALAREVRESAALVPWSSSDVQLRHCLHATYVVRLGAEGAWFHPGSQTYCEDDGPTEIVGTPPVRRLPGQTSMDLRARLALVPWLRACGNCSRRIVPGRPDVTAELSPNATVWVHQDTRDPMCHPDLPNQSAYADPGGTE